MEEHNAYVDEWYGSQSLDPSNVKYVYKYSIDDNIVKKNLLMPFPSDEITKNENISQEDQNFGY